MKHDLDLEALTDGAIQRVASDLADSLVDNEGQEKAEVRSILEASLYESGKRLFLDALRSLLDASEG